MFIEYIKAFALIYVISVCAMYLLSYRQHQAIEFPGDFIMKKGRMILYIPLTSSLVLAIVLFLLYRSIAAPIFESRQAELNSVPGIDSTVR